MVIRSPGSRGLDSAARGDGVEPAEPGGDEESTELVAVQRDGV